MVLPIPSINHSSGLLKVTGRSANTSNIFPVVSMSSTSPGPTMLRGGLNEETEHLKGVPLTS